MAEASKSGKNSVPKKRAPTLYFIIAIKLLKGTLAILLAFGVYKLAGKDIPDLFDRMLRFIHLDPENRFLSYIGDQLDNVKPASVRWFATGTFLYSLFSLVEGVGLIFRVPWAGWMTIGESLFFIPIELYEIARHHELVQRGIVPPSGFTWKVSVILGLNILIVWYLLQNRARLFKHHH
ncbi:MAG TPA: DUF2127 domain-containing protein [Candidatus Polarisedimenticolia bacterium]|nr:DUF2127 domain-containing protein [Candidatus Polarisedimenticolia bacterium]